MAVIVLRYHSLYTNVFVIIMFFRAFFKKRDTIVHNNEQTRTTLFFNLFKSDYQDFVESVADVDPGSPEFCLLSFVRSI